MRLPALHGGGAVIGLALGFTIGHRVMFVVPFVLWLRWRA